MTKELMFNVNHDKQEVFQAVRNYLIAEGFTIIEEDSKRPWGGYLKMPDNEIAKFIDHDFQGISFSEEELKLKMSPKYLIVEPNKRLSDQSHERRSEIWVVVAGPVKVFTADIGDEEGETRTYQIGDIVQLPQGKRHRLIGTEEGYGVVAEIWKHTDAENPSNEDDITRYQDDYGR